MNFKNELEHERQMGRYKNRIIMFGFLMMMTMAWGWAKAPDHITVHYPPDLRSGANLKINQIPPSEIYLFAQYLLQMLNRWDHDGAQDYRKNIDMFRYYLTPSYKQTLLEDYKQRKRQGELQNRIRALSPIQGTAYQEGDVQFDGDAWTVWINVNITEDVLGTQVKNVSMRYPIRVVRYDVDLNNNPWQLALDGSGNNAPTKIQVKVKD